MIGNRSFTRTPETSGWTLECGFEALEDRSLLAAGVAVIGPASDPNGPGQVALVDPLANSRSLVNVNGVSILALNLSEAGSLDFRALTELGEFASFEIYGDNGLIATSTNGAVSIPDLAAGNYYVRLLGAPSTAGLSTFNIDSNLTTAAGGLGTVTFLDQAPEVTGDFNVQAAAVIFRENALLASQSGQAAPGLTPVTGVTNNVELALSSTTIPLGNNTEASFLEPASLFSLLDPLSKDPMTLSQRQNLAPTITFDEARFRPENLDFTDSRPQRSSSNPEDPAIAIRFYQTEPADDRRAPVVVPGAWGLEDYLKEVLQESLDRMNDSQEFNRSGNRSSQPSSNPRGPRSSTESPHSAPSIEATDQYFADVAAENTPPAVPISDRRQE